MVATESVPTSVNDLVNQETARSNGRSCLD